MQASFKKEVIVNPNYFHFHDLPQTYVLKMSNAGLWDFINHIRRRVRLEFGYSLSDSAVDKKLGMKRGTLSFKLRTGGGFRIATLKKICSIANLPLEELEAVGVFKESFPVDCSKPNFVRIYASSINEGHISFYLNRPKSIKLLYINKDPQLVYEMINAVRSLRPGFNFKVIPRPSGLQISLPCDLAHALLKFGVPHGSKVRSHLYLSPIIKNDFVLWRTYFNLLLSEEGSCFLRVNQRGYLEMGIRWKRAFEVNLSTNDKKRLRPGQKIRFKQLPEHMQSAILHNKTNPLIYDEVITFEKMHNFATVLHLYPCEISVGKDYSILAHWEVKSSKSEVVNLIRWEYGLVPGTWSWLKFHSLYTFWNTHKGRRMRFNDVSELVKLKKQYSGKIRDWFVIKKLNELFPHLLQKCIKIQELEERRSGSSARNT